MKTQTGEEMTAKTVDISDVLGVYADKLLAIDSMLFRYLIEDESRDVLAGVIAIIQTELQTMADVLQGYSNACAYVERKGA